ncbi:MAG: aldehyde dehydrogenase [Candidatus Woesearchaeota archaeon]|nr:MAG: aldehyde dehydrogenase [Candidatus Woesearchaeota archaeon]
MKIINPTTEEVIKELAISTPSDVKKAVDKAKESFESWSKLDISKRIEIIKKFQALLKKNKKDFAKLISTEMGKCVIEAEGEIDATLGDIDYFISETPKAIKDEDLDIGLDKVSAKISYEPIGVIGMITPWNFPLDTPIWKIVPGLLTGNTIIFKPSELSTLSGIRIGELLEEAGLPKNVFNVIIGEAKTGKALVESEVNMISFTGSSEVGKKVLSGSGQSLKKTVMELGGSDPFIVFKDAIIEQSVNAALFGRFLNCGQVCTAAKRIFVQKEIFDEFVSTFVDKVKKLRVGDPLDSNTEIGPIVSKEQLVNLEKQVKDAINKGAKSLCGGKRLSRKGYFYEPTVLVNIKENMTVFREEVFGPVASLIPFDSIEEAIKLANDTKYGLGASVWSQDEKVLDKVAKSIQSGMVWLNDFGTPYQQCPQGGIKESGLGRELSTYGIREFCNMKTVVKSRDKTIKQPWWFPY